MSNRVELIFTDEKADPLAGGSALGWDDAGWVSSTPGIDESCRTQVLWQGFTLHGYDGKTGMIYFKISRIKYYCTVLLRTFASRIETIASSRWTWVCTIASSASERAATPAKDVPPSKRSAFT